MTILHKKKKILVDSTKYNKKQKNIYNKKVKFNLKPKYNNFMDIDTIDNPMDIDTFDDSMDIDSNNNLMEIDT